MPGNHVFTPSMDAPAWPPPPPSSGLETMATMALDGAWMALEVDRDLIPGDRVRVTVDRDSVVEVAV